MYELKYYRTIYTLLNVLFKFDNSITNHFSQKW